MTLRSREAARDRGPPGGRLRPATAPAGAAPPGGRGTVSPPTRAISRPKRVRSTPASSPATAPDAARRPPASAVSGVTLVAQLSPNDQAVPANSGVRQNRGPPCTRLERVSGLAARCGDSPDGGGRPGAPEGPGAPD